MTALQRNSLLRIRLLFLAFAVAVSTAAANGITGRVFVDRNGSGIPDPGEPGIAGVAVSDGRTIVLTDGDGAYSLQADNEALFVFISLPRGYRAVGRFYANAKAPSPANFALTEWSASARDRVRFVQISDTHVTNEPDSARTFRGDLKEINELEPAPSFLLATGDLVDKGAETSHFDNYLAGIDTSALPIFSLPGNHDAKTAERLGHYHQYLGPDYYSFNFGSCHFVLVNGNPFVNSDADPFIDEFIRTGAIPEELDAAAATQLRWIQKDLAAAPKGATLLFGSHFMPTAAMLRLFSSFRAKVVLSGHWHGNRVRESNGVLDLNSPPLRFGGIDRHPRSFRVVDVSGGEVKNELRLGGFHRHAAIVAPGGVVAPGRGQVDILVNAYDSRWDVASIDCEVLNQHVTLHRSSPWSWSGQAQLPAGVAGPQKIFAIVHAANGQTWRAKGSFDVKSDAPELRLKWAASTGGFIGISSPRIGRLIVATGVDDSGSLDQVGVAAFNFDGSARWHFHTDSGIKNNIAIDRGRVFATSVSGTLYAIDEASGKLLWKAALDSQHARWEVAATTVAGGVVHVGAASYVAALDAATGKILWDTFVGDKTDWWPTSYPVPVIAGGKMLLSNLRYGATALDADTGRTAWRLEGTFANFAVAGSTIITVRNDHPTGLKPDTGEILWTGTDSLGGNASRPLLAGDRVVIGTADGTVRAFSSSNGEVIWSYQAGPSLTSLEPYKRGGSDVISSPAVADGIVYVGASDGVLHAISLADGHPIATYSLGVPIASSPVISGDTLYLGAYDGNLYAFTIAESETRREENP